MSKKLEWIKAVILLPGVVLVLVPSLLMYFDGFELLKPQSPWFWVCILSFAAGLFMALWTMRLFWDSGDGSPAPWAPPQNLVIVGPYRHVRNPMITAVFLMLFAISVFFQSFWTCVWFWVFVLINLIYLPLVEEKGLEKRFGEDYVRYKKSVPMWIPRLKPYVQDESQALEP